MTQPIIEIKGLGKKYRIGAHKEPYLSLRDEFVKTGRRIATAFSRLTTPHSPLDHSPEDFWALKDVSFSVQQGEAVGIIGRNGAGKSTLLKILSQITPPTEGEIIMRGRVASLLEVGTGFHPELTGRENIFLNGAILGMTRAEIRRKFDEIVAFAEVEKFLDTPVKRYSSGMYVRLAFAVAAHLEPEILVVDEVLAVGDAQFQKKCLGKMSEVAKEGRTVLFVSHNMQAIKMLCSRTILLEKGRMVSNGPSDVVVRQYFSSTYGTAASFEWTDPTTRPGDVDIRLCAVRLRDPDGNMKDVFETGRSVSVEIEVDIINVRKDLMIGFDLMRDETVTVLRSLQTDYSSEYGFRQGINVLQAQIPSNMLNAGTYNIAPRISIYCVKWIVDYHFPSVATFSMVFTHGNSEYMNHPDRWQNGIIAPVLKWTHLNP